jgi:hypothetical protein
MGGNLQDPKDSAHFDAHGWTGVSPEENERRSSLVSQDLSVDSKNTSAVATMNQVTLTKSAPCALAQAEVVLSKQWGWAISPIQGDVALYYQAYGVIRRGALDTKFEDDSVPLNFLAARGELNASVRGTIIRTLNLDQWSVSRPPDDMPVKGKGNAECFGDDSRQDISCRPLTEKFLLSLRHATKPEVIKAMGVEGREVEGAGLHFISNYSRGERWGSGIVNFVFNSEGHASIIFANLDRPIVERENENADIIWFVWNAELEPNGCSDLPHEALLKCATAIGGQIMRVWFSGPRLLHGLVRPGISLGREDFRPRCSRISL